MQKFVMIALAATLLSTAASANTVSIQCSKDVQRGTLKLTNPPVMNCDDFELVQKYIGSDVTVGPDSKVDDIISALETIQPPPSAQPVAKVTETPLESTFQGLSRNVGWFADEDDKCVKDRWIKLKFEDGGVTIRR